MYQVYGYDGNPKYESFNKFEDAIVEMENIGCLFSIKDLDTGDIVWSNFLAMDRNVKYEQLVRKVLNLKNKAEGY